MATVNKLLFENIDPRDYATDFEALQKFGFRKLDAFKEVIGFDEDSQGWVVVNKYHAVSGLFDELPTCAILKKQGFRVELIAESNKTISADAFVNDELYEMKRVSSAINLPRAIEKQLRLAYKKSENIVLHIDQPIDPNLLVAALRKAVFNHSGIKKVLLVWENKIRILTQQEILASVWLKQK